jgi:hypothetical protein
MRPIRSLVTRIPSAFRPRATTQRWCLRFETLEARDVPSALSVFDVTVREGPTPTGVLDPAGAASVGLSGTRGITFDNGPTDAHYGDLFVTGYLSHSVARFDWATQTYQPFVAPNSGGLTKPFGIVVGPDGNVYVADESQDIVFRYDGATGAPRPAPGQTGAVFVNEGTGGTNNTCSVAFGSDGDLYVSCEATNRILKFQGPSGSSPGAFLGVFATVSNNVSTINGISFLAFGPDGDLYVDATTTTGLGQIDRFDGSTGAPIGNGVFVPPGSGGLQDPREFFFDSTGTNLFVTSKDPVSPTLPPTGQVLRFQGPLGQNPGVFVETYLSAGQANVQIAIGLAQDTAGNLYISDRDTANVTRIAPNAKAAFTVMLDSPNASPVSVTYATATGTAVAGTDFTQTAGTLVFPAGTTSETINVPITNVATGGPTKTFTLNLSSPVNATLSRGQATGSILNRVTKFFVADGSFDRTFEYGSGGTSEEITTPVNDYGGTDSTPRGVATTAAGTTVWEVDANKNVYVYTNHGVLLGSWSAGGELRPSSQLTGIATNGTDLWLVDSFTDKVYKFAGAAGRLSGSQNAASSFKLSNGDGNPQDIVTDGTSFWVVGLSPTAAFAGLALPVTMDSGSVVAAWPCATARLIGLRTAGLEVLSDLRAGMAVPRMCAGRTCRSVAEPAPPSSSHQKLTRRLGPLRRLARRRLVVRGINAALPP